MSTIYERIKVLRKAKGLTQQKFADALGLKQNTVATYEMGKTAPSDRTIIDICEKFNVNEEWLRTGKGEMFAPVNRDKEIEAFMDTVMKSESADFRRRLVSVLSKLDSAEWKLLESMALKLAAEAEAVKLAPKRHVVKFAGRDGSYEERILTDDEYEKLKEELDAYPKAPDDL